MLRAFPERLRQDLPDGVVDGIVFVTKDPGEDGEASSVVFLLVVVPSA